ncbi:MAG TPA: hypothetical protein VGI92_07395 [Gemmatimonadales bacterium]|jgi:hypothetical protein
MRIAKRLMILMGLALLAGCGETAGISEPVLRHAFAVDSAQGVVTHAGSGPRKPFEN